MAKVIAGQVRHDVLYADEFLRHAEVLAGLRREEVMLLGALQRHWWASDLQEQSGLDRGNEARRRVIGELVPLPFPDVLEFSAAEAATVRTGFLAGWDTMGGAVYGPTRAFERLCRLIGLDSALEAEPA